MTLQDFGKVVKGKHPEFKNVDDATLAKQYIKKYPIYKSKIDNFDEEKKVETKVVPEPAKPDWQPSKMAQFATGFTKGILSTVKGAATLGEKILQAPLKLVGAKFDQESSAQKLQSVAEKKIGVRQGELTTPSTPYEAAGKTTEQISEFLVPEAVLPKVSKAVSGSKILAKAPSIVKSTAGLLSGAGAESALAASQTAIQKGTFNDKEVGSAAKWGFILPVAMKSMKLIKKGGQYVGKQAVGKSTGAGFDVINEAFNNPKVAKYANSVGGDVGSFTDDILTEVKTAANNLATKRGDDYVAALSKIKLENPQQLTSLVDDLTNTTKKTLDNFDIKVIEDINGGVKLDFGNSSIVEGQPVLQKALTDITNWNDFSVTGMDKLKKKLGIYLGQLSSSDKKVAKAVLAPIKSSIQTGLENNINGYKEMTSGYREASGMVDEIDKAFSLGDRKTKETAIKKIMMSLNQNQETKKELLKVLSNFGAKDTTAKISGALLSSATPRGLIGGATLSGAGLGMILSPSNIPGLLALAAVSSPRIAANIMSILGKVDRAMISANKFTPQITKALRELIVKAQNE